MLQPLHGLATDSNPAQPLASPVNQVFQFAYTSTCTAWSDGSKNTASSYLWIPEHCKRVRGLLILCSNVPEHMLVGHPAIREVCAANDLGIVWNVPSFMNWAKQQPGQRKMSEEYQTIVGFLQQQLDGLAKLSGYEEIATVPWLPMGESGHLIMVDALVEASPGRCIAGMWIKNSHLPPKNRTTPALVVYGTAQEWGQEKTDIRTKWNEVSKGYEGVLNQRRMNPNWALSYVLDGTSGHFDCAEGLTKYLARYIDLAARARLSEDGTPTLKPLQIETGVVADLPVPGHEGQPVLPAADAKVPLPWFFNEAQAHEAQLFGAINWQAQTQLPAFLDDSGEVLPFAFNGIQKLKPLVMEADGVTFTIRGKVLDQIPENFEHAGEKLAQAPGAPEVEWLCGPIEPLGLGKFRIALDRCWIGGSSTCYLAVRHKGTDSIRAVVQPGHLDVRALRNTEGKPQKITFDLIPEVWAGTESVVLSASSDAGLPVSFFVIAGPAVVRDGKLMFSQIPPRTRFPIEVTVGAWQWGRHDGELVQTAEVVTQSVRIQAAKP